MKKVLVALMFAVAMPLAVRANDVAPPPCVTGTFASYLALTDGCTVGDKVFSDFDYTSAGDNQLSAAQVTVTPDSSDPLNPGLKFTGTWIAAEGTTSDSTLEFTVSTLSHEPLIKDASLSILDPFTNGGGIVTVSESLCLGGTFIGGQCSSGVSASLGVSTFLNSTFDHTTFTPVSSVDVVKDIGLTAFGSGTTDFAFVSDVTNHFSQVPEPATLTLLGTGLVAIGAKLRRRMNQKKSS